MSAWNAFLQNVISTLEFVINFGLSFAYIISNECLVIICIFFQNNNSFEACKALNDHNAKTWSSASYVAWVQNWEQCTVCNF